MSNLKVQQREFFLERREVIGISEGGNSRRERSALSSNHTLVISDGSFLFTTTV